MSKGQPVIIVKKKGHGGHGHHGGAWKVAYADFVTAMMAFFLVMWPVGQSPQVKAAVGGYFRDPGVFETTKGGGVLPGSVDGLKDSGVTPEPPDSVKQAQEVLERAAEHLREALQKVPALKALEGSDEKLGKESIMALMKAVDEYIPQPERPKDQPFLMPVEDVFSISGRGTVCTGRVERGIIKVGEEVEIVGIKPTTKTVVTGVEMFRKLLDQGEAGDNIGCLLRGTKREEVERGQVLCRPGSVKPHTKFKAEAYILTKEEGGRHTPFFTNYRPQFYFRTTDVTGVVHLPQGTEMVMPGDNVAMEVHLIVPIAMEEKLRFAIREGGRTVGAGVVASIIE